MALQVALYPNASQGGAVHTLDGAALGVRPGIYDLGKRGLDWESAVLASRSGSVIILVK